MDKVNPQTAQTSSPQNIIKEPKIGIALGGGGIKSFAHIGILKTFEKYGVKISAVTGASGGAMAGAGYALGQTPDEILKNCEGFYKKKILRLSNLHIFHESLIKSKDIEKAIKYLVGEQTFEETKIPFATLAVDLESGKEVVLREGKLWEALRASSAIPMIFSPYFLNDRYLVDGGLTNNVPVNLLREISNPDIVIGVEIGSLVSRQYIAGMIWERYYRKPEAFKLYPGKLARLKLNLLLMVHILLRSIDVLREETQQTRYAKAKPDMIIHPDVENIGLLDSEKYMEAVRAGMEAAEKAMPQVFDLIAKKKEELNK